MKYVIITPDNLSHQKLSAVKYTHVVAIKNKNMWEIKKWCKSFKEATDCVSELSEITEIIILPIRASLLPQPAPNPDFSKLKNLVTNGVKEMDERQYEDDDFRQYVYEEAITAIYGKCFWDWRNSQKY